MSKASIFRKTVIKPTLTALNLGGNAAEELLLGTAVQESLNFTYREQVGGGPAVSYYQMEPATHDDIWENFLNYRETLAEQVRSLLTSSEADKIEELRDNDRYATAMARIHYLRVAESIPRAGDVRAQANYWKKYYNTPLGKGLPSEYITKWNRYVLEENK